jgi:hypothetical protein
LRPRAIQPAKHFWKVGSRQCVMYVIDGAFEVRLLEESMVMGLAVCRDGRHARETAREWLTRPPHPMAKTPCPRCAANDTRPSTRTEGFVYLRCIACHAVWRIPERRASDRVKAEGAFSRRHHSNERGLL